MLGLKDFSISFLTGTPVFVWLALVALLALVFLLYYRTNPPLPRYLRIIMGALRAVAIIALLLALLEPVIKYQRDYERPRRISVLLDNSLSMDRVEANLSRKARLDSLLSGSSFDRVNKATAVSTFWFGGSLETASDKVARDRTALGDALFDLKSRQMTEPSDLWLLFTDGRSNSGRSVSDVAAGLGIPVTSVDLATDIGGLDIGIETVDYNAVLFMGQPCEIKVKLVWRNAAGKTTKIRLLDGEHAAAEADFPISEPAGHGDVTLKYIPTQPGQRLLKVTVAGAEGDESAANNSRTISVKVLKSRLQVLLVTDHPDYEIGFLRRFLLRSDKYDVTLLATGPRAGNLSGKFPSAQTELNRYDLVILYDPDPSAYEGKGPILKSYLSEKGGAIWVMMGESFANRGPVKWFNDLLPFAQSSRRAVEYFDFHGEPSENDLFHPAVRLAENRTAIRETWNSLPPFRSLVRCDMIDPTSTPLVYASILSLPSAKTPILSYKRFGPGKLMASAALPFWTWGFMSIGFGGTDSTYTGFMEGTIRWLTVRDDFDPVRVTPEKEVFTRGEPIRFQGYAFDQGYRAIPGVTGTVTIKNAERNISLDADLVPHGEGRFEASLDQVPPGRYSYTAILQRDNTELKRSEGSVAVEEFSLEEYDQSGDPSTLAAVARLTGGKYYSYRQFDEAASSLDVAPVRESRAGEVVLYNKFWLLLLFILGLSAEWVMRKLSQLI